MGEKANKINTAQTIADFSSGSQEAFAVIYDLYAPALFGMIVHRVGNTVVAEDILKQAFVTAWNDRSACHHSRGGFFSWLSGIVKNLFAETNTGEGKDPTPNYYTGNTIYTEGQQQSVL